MKAETPLFDALKDYARRRPARFHMPGHKGKGPAGLDVFKLDVTELPGTGDLYAGDDVIARAEALWAKAWGFPTCQFLTGGSTQGLHTALLLCARRGRELLVDRCAHRCVHNAMALFDLRPTYLSRPQDAPLTPDMLETCFRLAREHGKELHAVCITSPTYYGVLSDIPALAGVAHSHGALLVVDAAHGCHLPFLGQNPFAGADLVVASGHKTLPVLGQGAVLFAGEALDPGEVKKAAAVNGTSSPSYPVMASMDLARAYCESKKGRRELARLAEYVDKCKARFPALSGPGTDPLRLTLYVPGGAGFVWKERLERAWNIFAEMADRDHLVFLLSPNNKRRELARLERALENLYGKSGRDTLPPRLLPCPLPPVRLTPREALLAPGLRQTLADSQGEVCLEQVAPYPPGVPVIAPGEEITKKGLAYLQEVGYNVDTQVNILDRGRWEEAVP